MESWRSSRNPDSKDANGFKNEADRWRKRDDKIEDSLWKRREPERRDMDKWRRGDESDRWKKDSMETKWRKDDNYDDLRDRDRLDNRGFDKRDDRDRDRDRDRERERDRDRDRDRDRGIDGRPVSMRSKYDTTTHTLHVHI